MLEYRMKHAIHFLSVVLKDVPNRICDSQLATIESVRAIFANWQAVDPLPTVYPTQVPNPPNPIVRLPKPSPLRFPAPTSKGDHGRDRVTTSKGDFKKQALVITKKHQVAVNSKGDQEPISVRTVSRVDPSPDIPPFEAQIQPLD